MESKIPFILQKVDKLVSNLVYKYVNNSHPIANECY